ncbi:CoxG family protein [Rhodoferax sediminis]|uniref:Carbon monoxide dehydrogenase n=1 Tax=Rhodoferax sediminis TaxID=2509614 RepID=A0A515DAE1_9BURK|nr:carbon monoxide dehydrogenase subunit G [Rhodoferax sediminis]QDL37369.1 carbon monoxide dehydrogenase [Rhodoferax sediminis]
MELTGHQLLPIPRDRVWSALLDPETLRAAIPGCEFVTDEGNGLYTVGVLAAVGPVKARFKGRMQQQDVQPPNRYTLSFEGDGGIAGFAKGSAEVELLEEGEGRDNTRLNYRAQAQIGGRLAQIGSRLVDATAAKMSAQFFDRLTQVITAPAGAPEAALAEAQVVARPAAVGVPVAVQAAPGTVTIQMPAWAWAFTLAALVALIGWLAVN